MSQSSQQIFSDANHLTFHGGQFSNVQGDMHIHSVATERYGLKLLLQNIVPGALHDAAERGDQPGCHENTRVAILKEIMDWLQDPNTRERFIYWLYGPAGSGKTSISQSIAEALAKLKLLAASFFFWRSAAGRNTSDHFTATIAYQLSRSIPTMSDPLYTAIERDPIIFSKSLSTQLQVLIINPLKAALECAPPDETPERIIIIIDGLDECSPAKSQVELLALLRTAVEEFRSIPFLCLVSSRPEYEIRSTFADSNPLGAITTTLALENDYQTYEDIKFFLVSKFNKIRDEHLQLGSRLPTSWPVDHAIDCIVRMASGQFIFGATAMKFIDDPRGDPVERLKIILGLSKLGPGQMPFAQLDELYRTILASIAPDSLPKVLDILSLIILGPGLGFTPGPYFESGCPKLYNGVIGDLLALDVPKTLIDMHALVHVPSVDSQYWLHLHHKSFRDFLLDKSRSREYYLETIQVYPRLTRHFIHALENFNILKTLQGSEDFDMFFGIFDDLSRYLHPDKTLANSFASFNMKSVMTHHCRLHNSSFKIWDSFLYCAKILVECRPDIFPRLWNEFCTVYLDHIPTQLHSFIPTIISFKKHARDMITILGFPFVHGVETFAWPSDTDIPDTLLNLLTHEGSQYHLDYIADCKVLGKHIIEVIFPMPGQKGYEEQLLDRVVSHPNLWYPELLLRIPMDLEFGEFLCCRSLQFFQNCEYNIAKYSLEYVKACGIPYLEHTHRPDLLGCIICDEHPNATVLELDVPTQNKFDTLFLCKISQSAEAILRTTALVNINSYGPGYIGDLFGRPLQETNDLESHPHMATVAFKTFYRCTTGDSVDDQKKVRELSFLILARQIMGKLLFETDFQDRNTIFPNYVEGVISLCPIDSDLAAFLRDHVLQFRKHPKSQQIPTNKQKWASAYCLEYVQRCRIPYLEHTHPPDTVFCATCRLAVGASVVDTEQLPYVQTTVQSLTIASPEFLSAAKLFLERLKTPRTDKNDLEDVPEALAKRRRSEEDGQDDDNGATKKQRQIASSA